MKRSFWIKRFFVVFSGAFLVLFAVYLVRGQSPTAAAKESALWSALATIIFIATRLYRSRKGEHCELCGDTPETADKSQCSLPQNSGSKS
jgi:hypothetical protein